MTNIKQVIVFNNSLRNVNGHKLRTGKIAAHVAHASLNSYLMSLQDKFWRNIAEKWFESNYTKIVLKVNSEDELLKLRNKCINYVPYSLVQDIGNTEFGGIATITCLGIGPYYGEEIDTITNGLELL